MKRITKFFTIFCIGMIWNPLYAQPDTEPVPIHFSVTNTGINRFIADQWSSTTTNWTGSYQGMNYTIDLKRPIVDLSDNTFKITLKMHVYATFYGSTLMNEDLTISPEVSISPITVDPNGVIEDVRVEYDNLAEVVNNAPIPDGRIRYVIRDKLEDIDWVIYQGEVLSQSTLRWSDTFDVGFYGLPEVSFSIGEGELILTVSPEVYGNEPDYQFQWRRPGSTSYQVRVLSNNEIDLKSIQTSTTAGQSSSINVSVSSSFNTSLNKYVAVYSFGGGSATGQLICKLRLMRAGLETVWTVQGFVSSTTSSWTNFTSVTPVWGE